METNGIELQSSRNGLSIPVINGVYLHSVYNPQKEAEAFVEKNENIINRKNNLIILGLGFGYHIEQVAKKLNESGEYKIIVIEPNKELVNLFEETRPFYDSNIQIVSYETIEEYYLDRNFSNFLSQKPGIIKLDTAFNLNKEFYKSFLTFKAQTELSAYRTSLSENSCNLLGHRGDSLFNITREIKNQRVVSSKKDYLILALSELAKNSQEVSQWKKYYFQF